MDWRTTQGRVSGSTNQRGLAKAINHKLYFDNNATTACDPAAVEAMLPFFLEHFANPSGLYRCAEYCQDAVRASRLAVADLVNSKESEVVFVGCGTEADNTAISSAIRCRPDSKHIVISAVEHPAVQEVVKQLERGGYEITKVRPGPLGSLTLEQVVSAIRPDTALVSIMAANNETGALNPVYQIGHYISQLINKPLYHIDATQAIGKVPFDFAQTKADYAAFSAHKFHGPKGVGVLLVKDGACFKPLLVGGGQENKCRAGTENVPGIIGTGIAAELAKKNLPLVQQKVKARRDWLESKIKTIFGPDCLVLAEKAARTPNTSFIALRGSNGRRIQKFLADFDIAIGTGSACSCLKKHTPSATVTSMGVPPEFQKGTMRISLSKYHTEEFGCKIHDFQPLLDKLSYLKKFPMLHRDGFVR